MFFLVNSYKIERNVAVRPTYVYVRYEINFSSPEAAWSDFLAVIASNKLPYQPIVLESCISYSTFAYLHVQNQSPINV